MKNKSQPFFSIFSKAQEELETIWDQNIFPTIPVNDCKFEQPDKIVYDLFHFNS